MQGKLISTKITLHTNKIQVRLRISYLIYLLGQAIWCTVCSLQFLQDGLHCELKV